MALFMTNSNLQENTTEIFSQLFSYLNIENKFMCEVPESSLNSIAGYNVLCGIGGDYEGNFMFGFTEKSAIDIVNALMDTKNVESIDGSVKSALADFFIDFTKRVIALTNPDDKILFSSPAYIAGNTMQAMISKVPAINLFFKIAGEKFSISYYLEKL